MTGTSLDALDVALVEILGHGIAMKPRFVRGASRSLTGVRDSLRALAEQTPLPAGQIARLMLDFSALHADAIESLLSGERCDLVCVHGQTVAHVPPASWQLMQPAPIAHRLGTPVVFDLRQADLAAGGQGAPLTPIADWVWVRSLAPGQGATRTAVVNLGGFCNVTVLGPGASSDGVPDARGFDLCPCNQLLDAIARKLMHREFDEDGAEAMSGEVHAAAFEDLLGALVALAKPGRSLGTGDEALEWITRWRAQATPRDLAASACEAIGERIGEATREAGLVLLAGGGVRNRRLVRAIESCAPARVRSTGAFGLPEEYREAAHFAVLGALCQDRVAITNRTMSNGSMAPGPIAGAWVIP
jgi:anhydro-N-acetylmuramic acid kinase